MLDGDWSSDVCSSDLPLFYGLCRSSAQHPGTVGITGDVLRALIHDIGRDLWRQGVHSLCLLTGHAGGTHQACLVEAGEQLLQTTGLQVAVVCVLDLLEQAKLFLECPGDSHAGEVETSLALHLWPELVQGSAEEAYPTFPRFVLVRDKLSHWPTGVWGDPTKASADKGRRILEVEARGLAQVLQELESRAAAGPDQPT
jgi:creatinine amidohydrolase